MRDLQRDPLRLGILGCGSFIQRRILPYLDEIDTVKITCLQKRDIGEAEQVAKKYRVPHAVSTREELLSHPDVEAVFIGTPNHMHENDAIACAAAGKPTLCEKPLAPTGEAALRIVEAFRKANVPLFVGHAMRFKPSVLLAQKMLQEGALGKLLKIHAHFTISLPKANWRFQKECGGGSMQDLGVHLIDLIRFVTGQSIQSVFAVVDGEEVDRTVTAVGRLSGGATMSFESSFEHPFYSGFELVGSESRLISRNSLRQTFDAIETLEHLQADGTVVSFPIKAHNIFVDELKHLAECIVNGAHSCLDGSNGVENQKVVDAAYLSARSKQEVLV
ncbi:MAG: Gfo/Idh/MocA family oxidoreductase [Chlamydiales bacterium]|nr:Gfo/Idh/MocA family oxidoreductase [Chlamydiales bacterium]